MEPIFTEQMMKFKFKYPCSYCKQKEKIILVLENDVKELEEKIKIAKDENYALGSCLKATVNVLHEEKEFGEVDKSSASEAIEYDYNKFKLKKQNDLDFLKQDILFLQKYREDTFELNKKTQKELDDFRIEQIELNGTYEKRIEHLKKMEDRINKIDDKINEKIYKLETNFKIMIIDLREVFNRISLLENK